MQLTYLLRYAGEHLAVYEVEQFRNDMAVLGKGRVNGEFGWFEYEVIA